MTLNRRAFIMSLGALGVTACAKRQTMPFPELGSAHPPFPEVVATGSPGEIGLVQGRAFASRISDNFDFYIDWLSTSGDTTPDRLLDLARSFGPVLDAHFPAMLEEIDGVAMGSGRRLEEILLINARTDILAIVEAERAVRKVPGCTALALEGGEGYRPSITLSQNWDWDPLLSDAAVILRSRPTNQPAIVTLVEAGMIGKIGFNQHGLGVCLNFLSHETDGEPGVIGVPIHCLLRAVMNCTTIDEAVATVSAAPRCASANFLIAQYGLGGPRSLDLEISPLKVAVISDQKAGLVHTNHFLDPELAVGGTSGRGPSTMKRFEEARELVVALETVEPDPVIRAQRVLESRANLPYPISRHHNPDPSSSTLAGIIMDLTNNRFIVANGAPHQSEWVELPGI